MTLEYVFAGGTSSVDGNILFISTEDNYLSNGKHVAKFASCQHGLFSIRGTIFFWPYEKFTWKIIKMKFWLRFLPLMLLLALYKISICILSTMQMLFNSKKKTFILKEKSNLLGLNIQLWDRVFDIFCSI